MCARQIMILFCTLLGAIAIPLDLHAEPKANAIAKPPQANVETTAGPPALGAAVVVDARTIEVRRFVIQIVTRVTGPGLPPGVIAELGAGQIMPATKTVPVVMTCPERIPLTNVRVRRLDGRVLSCEELLRELAKPIPVILKGRIRRIDPFFAQMFKPDSLVIELPTLVVKPASVAPGVPVDENTVEMPKE